MNTSLPTRPVLNTRLRIALAADDKHRLFAVAAKKRITVSELVRNAIARAEGETLAA